MKNRLTVTEKRSLRRASDRFLAKEWARIQARQSAYFTTKGKYFQGLPTHASAPVHTDSAFPTPAPDRLTTKPTDQAEDWLSQFSEWNGMAMPSLVRMDVYDGPQGKGYVVTVEAFRGTQRWRRSINVGPETYRGRAWAPHTPPTL